MKKKHDWYTMILEVSEREECKCQRCHCEVRYLGPTNVHHYLPRSRGGSDKSSNLRLLCDSAYGNGCHEWVHDHPKDAVAEGFIAPMGYKEK